MTAEPVRAWILIDAPPERVWEFFTQPEAMTRWMGEYAVLAPRPGGEFTVNIRAPQSAAATSSWTRRTGSW